LEFIAKVKGAIAAHVGGSAKGQWRFGRKVREARPEELIKGKGRHFGRLCTLGSVLRTARLQF
jgi:hypothetical protein